MLRRVPLLRLEVRYGESHVRTRAIDARGKYTDSIGANDLAEAVFLVGRVVRYGETMHARRLRQQPAASAPEPARFVRLADKQVDYIKQSLLQTARTVRDMHYPDQTSEETLRRLRAHEEMHTSIREE
jgi:hypothetical protein